MKNLVIQRDTATPIVIDEVVTHICINVVESKLYLATSTSAVLCLSLDRLTVRRGNDDHSPTTLLG